MKQQPPLILQIVRFGLPLVVAVYYITAARGFSYTADPGYAAADWATLLLGQRFGIPGTQMYSLFWTVLLALGGTLGLDLLLVAKIMSLLFACFGILGLYLLSVEILDDRILAFSVALIAALDPLLLQAGPSGTPATALLALSVASLFFARREDFALGAVFAGLSTMLAWPAVILMVSLGLEVVSLPNRRPRVKMLFASAAVFLAVVLPWVVFARLKGLPVISDSSIPGGALAIGWWTVIPAAICLIPAIAGILAVQRVRLLRLLVGDPSRGLLVWILWTAVAGAVWSRDFWLAGSLVLLPGAMQGLRVLVPGLREEFANYSAAIGATAVLLVVNQVIFLSAGSSTMSGSVDAEQDVVAIVQWVSAKLPANISIESEAPGLTEYHLRSGQQVTPRPARLPADYLITSDRSVTGYREIFRPLQPGVDPLGNTSGRLALFQRLEPEKSP